MRDETGLNQPRNPAHGGRRAAMEPHFQLEALSGVKRLRQALRNSNGTDAAWRDGALALFHFLRLQAGAREYHLVEQLAALGGVAASYDGRAPETARMLCRHVAKALNIALETGVTDPGAPVARALVSRLSDMADAQALAPAPVTSPPRPE